MEAGEPTARKGSGDVRENDGTGSAEAAKDTVIVDDDSDSDPEKGPVEKRIEEELPHVHDDAPANIDDPSYQYEAQSVHEKLENAKKSKEEGNAHFKKGNYAEAEKSYDHAFVSIFIGKEEWAAMDEADRKIINDFKVPCHLNRGFCRLKMEQYDNALWEFSEVVRLDPENVKARYRRSLARMALIQREMKKEEQGAFWDVEKQQNTAAETRDDLVFSIKKCPNDKNLRTALDNLKEIDESLRASRKKYRDEQVRLFSGFLNKPENEPEEEVDYSLMPALEAVHIGPV
mmetsp:Transcript_3147/g.9599  ORF Transcript_3147/g.9599 Transcript_3147/m.9599 type:complete len:288 (+) Transcript_3147:113-976(+)